MRLHLSLLCATFCLFSIVVDSHLPSSPVAHTDHLFLSFRISWDIASIGSVSFHPCCPTVWASWMWCSVDNFQQKDIFNSTFLCLMCWGCLLTETRLAKARHFQATALFSLTVHHAWCWSDLDLEEIFCKWSQSPSERETETEPGHFYSLPQASVTLCFSLLIIIKSVFW